MAYNFQSSAVSSISDMEDGNVSIVFNNGREYVYSVADSSFRENLNLVIENEDSVGKFVNLAIRNQDIVLVWFKHLDEI